MNARNSENGRIIIFVLITVFTLSAFWFIALAVTGSELQVVGGKKSAAQQFFDAEAGVNAIIENFNAATPVLNGDLTTVLYSASIKDPTSDPDPAKQRVVAQVTVRPVQNIDATAASNNRLPLQAHEFDPPVGSGSGVNTAVSRRYAITAASGNKEIQVGVYRTVPK